MSVHELFPGYYRPTDEQFAVMWRDGVFAFDANILLHIYRFTPDTVNTFFDYLSRLRDRIWVPHQAYLDFQENRLSVITQQEDAYEAIEKMLRANLATIVAALRERKRHPYVSFEDLAATLVRAQTRINKQLHALHKQHPDLLEHDELRTKLDTLFASRIGSPYADADLERYHKEAERRINQRIPPGYMDAKKDRSTRNEGDGSGVAGTSKEGIRRFGDVILWFQILDHAQAVKKPIILISDDAKEDWWLIHHGRTIGPRPELVAEMRRKANMDFYMYSSDRFLERAADFLQLQRQQDAIEEARELRQEDIAIQKQDTQSTAVANLYSALSRRTRPDYNYLAHLTPNLAVVSNALKAANLGANLAAVSNALKVADAVANLAALSNTQILANALASLPKPDYSGLVGAIAADLPPLSESAEENTEEDTDDEDREVDEDNDE